MKRIVSAIVLASAVLWIAGAAVAIDRLSDGALDRVEDPREPRPGATPRFAESLYSAPLHRSGGMRFQCQILNVAPASRWVRIDAFDSSGRRQSTRIRRLRAGETMVHRHTATGDGPYYCRFDVEGSATSFQASACTESHGGCLATVAAR